MRRILFLILTIAMTTKTMAMSKKQNQKLLRMDVYFSMENLDVDGYYFESFAVNQSDGNNFELRGYSSDMSNFLKVLLLPVSRDGNKSLTMGICVKREKKTEIPLQRHECDFVEKISMNFDFDVLTMIISEYDSRITYRVMVKKNSPFKLAASTK